MFRLMIGACRGLLLTPRRSLALFALLCASFLALTLLRSGYADMFDRIKRTMREKEGDIILTNSSGEGLSIEEYRRMQKFLIAGGGFQKIRASLPIDGLVGAGDKSAPVNGRAIEDSALEFSFDDCISEVRLGEALARTLGVNPQDELSALIGDTGFSLRLSSSVKTESATLDRFYIELPLEVFENADPSRSVDTINLWLSDARIGVTDRIRELSAIPELSTYTASAYELGNTDANRIVKVYEENYRVVLVAVVLTMLLAFGNTMLLSSWERGSEWGTMLALGARFSKILSVLCAETFVLSVASSITGSAIALAVASFFNSRGGLVLPPPPTQENPISFCFKLEITAFASACALVCLCALTAALAGAWAVRRKTTIELLFERN